MIHITATHLLAYSFCSRFVYYQYFLGIREHQEKHFKVLKGREVHDRKEKLNPRYLRKKIDVIHREIALPLFSKDGLLSGVVDEVLTLKDQTMAPLDYKWTQWKDFVFPTYKLQLTFYAKLISEMFQSPVQQGFLVYVRSKDKIVSVPITPQDHALLDETIDNIANIILNGYFPPKSSSRSQCIDCTYKNLCAQI